MHRFVRTAAVKHAGSIYTALQAASEITAHVNKQYALDLKYGVELFSEPVFHWHFDSESADKIYELFGKLGEDREYAALMDKYKDIWLEGSLKDRLIALMG